MIDVCVVSRTPTTPKGLEHIPINQLINETSSPVGDARVAAIQRVKTDVFAFVDEDVEVTPDWYQKTIPYMSQGYGAVYSNPTQVGLGKRFDHALLTRKETRLMRKGERFDTNLCLISHAAVINWRPVNRRCYEDKDLGDWLLNFGHQILLVPTDAKHHRTWRGIAKSAMWAGREYEYVTKHAFPEYLKLIFMPIKAMITRGFFVMIFIIWRNFFMIIGMLNTDIRKVIR